MFGIDERGRLGSYYIAGAIRIREKDGRTKTIVRTWVGARSINRLCGQTAMIKRSSFDEHGDSRGGIVADS